MKYVDEYRDGALARSLAAGIAREARPDRVYRLMEFCGGHTHAISRYGLEDLLPPNVRMIHGPGCPVCVLPMARVDMAIACARDPRSHALRLRRPDARSRIERLEPAQGQGGRRRHPHGLFDARRDPHRRGRARPRGRVLRHRLRDDDAADRAGDPRRREEGPEEFLDSLQSRDDAAGDAGDSRRRDRRRRRAAS